MKKPTYLCSEKDSLLYFCLDYRKINSATVRDVFPLPEKDEYFYLLGEKHNYSNSDTIFGYWKVEINMHFKKINLSGHHELYQFMPMLFGPKESLISFRSAKDIVLRSGKWWSAFVYLEHTVFFSKTVEQNLTRLQHVLTLPRSDSVSFKLKKSSLIADTNSYFGYVIRPCLN